MGLALSVGMLVDQSENDPEGFEQYKAWFANLNHVLKGAGLPSHEEPLSGEGLPWDGDMPGYSGLHSIRRLGAYLWSGRPLPPPADVDATGDPVLMNVYRSGEPRSPGLLGRMLGRKASRGPSFEHLIHHSDAEGFYVPTEFERVIVCDEELVPGGMIGSTPRLLAELEVLFRELDLPRDLDPESDEVLEAEEGGSKSGPKWKRYGGVSFGLLQLRKACEVSLNRGAAIVFH